ncbi:MAG: preprotein translocase subunit YajC [Microthrixaceae bacterium]
MNALSPSVVAAASGSSGGLANLLLLIVFIPLIYMMIVPQRRQRKQHAEFLGGIQVGDEVMTTGGLYGTISYLEDNVAHLEVDTDVVIRVSKSSLTAVPASTDASTKQGAGRAGASSGAKTASANRADTDDPPKSGLKGLLDSAKGALGAPVDVTDERTPAANGSSKSANKKKK